MNPVVAEIEVIMPKEILASKNELPVKLFLHAVRLFVTMINLCKVSADIHNAMYLHCRLWVKYCSFHHYLSGPEFEIRFVLVSFSTFSPHLTLACSLYSSSKSMAWCIYFSFQHLRFSYSAKGVLIPEQVSVSDLAVILPMDMLGSRLDLLSTQSPSSALQILQ